jgi:hypothetical protein
MHISRPRSQLSVRIDRCQIPAAPYVKDATMEAITLVGLLFAVITLASGHARQGDEKLMPICLAANVVHLSNAFVVSLVGLSPEVTA